MTTIRVCFTTIPSLLNQTKFGLKLIQQSSANVHYFSQKSRFLAPSHSFCTSQKRFFLKSEGQQPPEDRIRVYNGLLSSQIRNVKWFSLTTSFIGIMSQPILYQQLSALQNLPMLVFGCSVVGIYTFVTPFLLHFVSKKYVTMLDYNSKKDSYIATTTNFFGMKKELEFTPEDVYVPEIPGMFTTFHAKGQPLFLEAQQFEDPGHYARIMGYDKPMDFKLYQTAEDTTDVNKTGKK